MSTDVIVIGGGVNGLVVAAQLARAGRAVQLFERRPGVGGMAAPLRFGEDHVVPGLLHDACALPSPVIAELKLAAHGLQLTEPAPVFAPQRDGPGLLLTRDPARDRGALGADADRYYEWQAWLARVRGAVRAVFDRPPPRLDGVGGGDALALALQGWSLRRLGARDLTTLLRVAPQSVKDWLDTHFEGPLLKATLAAPALSGSWCGPYSAGTAALLLLRECAQTTAVRGGPAALVRALASACRALRVSTRLDAAVRSIDIRDGAVRGVTLASGEQVEAPRVVSTLDPKTTLLGLIAPRELPAVLERGARRWRARGTTAKVHLAVDGPIEWIGRPGETFARVHIGEDLVTLERAFDAVKYRTFSEAPTLDVSVPTLEDPSLAPSGRQVVSIVVHYVPHALDGGWTDAARARLEAIVLRRLAPYTVNLEQRIVAREVLTPVDIEARFGTAGGHVHHGEPALDQLLTLRPMPECARHATPIRGLFLAGSGTHSPATTAAKAIRAGSKGR